MTECPVFIDYEDVRANLSRDAVIGGVRYRSRPRDTGCLHTSVTFGTPDRGMVDCECDKCGHRWSMVKIVEVTP
jgi:hypothetical protein